MSELPDPFAPDLRARFEATRDIASITYATAAEGWPGEEAFREGWKAIQHLIPADLRMVATSDDVHAYGAWNPTILVVGPSPGKGGTALAREEEHMVGAPGFFQLFQFPAYVQSLVCTGFGYAVDMAPQKFSWLRPWILDRPQEFRVAAGSSFAVLNLTSKRRDAGDRVDIPPAIAAKRVERHLIAFKPRVVIADKPEITRLLRDAFPEAKIPEPRPNSLDGVVKPQAQFGDHVAQFLGLPLHPDARFSDSQRQRQAASFDPVARAIGSAICRI